MNKLLILMCCVLSLGLTACKNDKKSSEEVAMVYQCPMKCEGDKTYSEPGKCPVCDMNLREVNSEDLGKHEIEREKSSKEISDTSIFNLNSTWTNQDGKDMQLKELKGDVLVMVMIYSSCKAACPRLVADMRTIHDRLPEETKQKVKMVFVSIDPNTDTTPRLKAFAKENYMDEAPWTFLRSSEDNTREIAAVLGVNYKKISPLDFSHSNIISVINDKGEMVYQQEGLGANSDETVQHIEDAVKNIN